MASCVTLPQHMIASTSANPGYHRNTYLNICQSRPNASSLIVVSLPLKRTLPMVMQTFIMPAPIRSLFSHACPPIIPNQPTQIYTHRKRRTPPRVVCSARVQHVSARNGVALGLRLDARFDLQDACMSVRGSRKRCFRKRQDAHNALQAMEP
jgi:hypothetical protein